MPGYALSDKNTQEKEKKKTTKMHKSKGGRKKVCFPLLCKFQRYTVGSAWLDTSVLAMLLLLQLRQACFPSVACYPSPHFAEVEATVNGIEAEPGG